MSKYAHRTHLAELDNSRGHYTATFKGVCVLNPIRGREDRKVRKSAVLLVDIHDDAGDLVIDHAFATDWSAAFHGLNLKRGNLVFIEAKIGQYWRTDHWDYSFVRIMKARKVDSIQIRK